MSSGPDPIILFSASAALVAELLALIVWCVGLARVRRPFFWILLLSSLLALVFTSVNGTMVYNPQLAMRLFQSRDQFLKFYHVFVCAQAANLFLFVLGQIFLVRWLIRAKRSSGQKSGVVIDRLI